MKKPIILTIIGLFVLVVILGGIKFLQFGTMMAQGKQSGPPPETVTSATVTRDSWETLVTAVGSLDAVQGVTITAEVTGKVAKIAFQPGSKVAAGDLLVQQDISAETAQLRSAEATADLARINFERSEKLLPERSFPSPTTTTTGRN